MSEKIVDPNGWWTLGIVCCALSHAKAWKEFLDTNEVWKKWPIFSAAYFKIPENITTSMPASAGEEKSANFN